MDTFFSYISYDDYYEDPGLLKHTVHARLCLGFSIEYAGKQGMLEKTLTRGIEEYEDKVKI